jgi:hypothetical protein
MLDSHRNIHDGKEEPKAKVPSWQVLSHMYGSFNIFFLLLVQYFFATNLSYKLTEVVRRTRLCNTTSLSKNWKMLKYLRMDVLWSWILDFFPLSLVIHNHKDFFFNKRHCRGSCTTTKRGAGLMARSTAHLQPKLNVWLASLNKELSPCVLLRLEKWVNHLT